MSKDIRFYVDIARIDEEKRMVYGYGTRGDIKDSYGTIIDMDSVKKCLPDYMKFPTIREMHQLSAVGRSDDVTADDKGVYIGAKIVDDQAWEKVKEKVYRGFSIGGKKDYQVDDTIFLKKITEFSLVDVPSNEGCEIDEYRIYKEEKGVKKKATKEEPAEIVNKIAIDGDIKRFTGEESYDAATALDALLNIQYLFAKESSEDEPEEEQLAALQIVIEKLKAFIASEVMETDENTAAVEMVFKAMAPDVERKGAAINKTNLQRIQGIHDHASAMGARCDGGNVEKAEEADVKRLAGLEADVTRLQGENEVLKAEKVKADEEIVRLKAEPAETKSVLKIVVGKEEDTILRAEEKAKAEDEVKRIDALPPAQQAVEYAKLAQRIPLVMRGQTMRPAIQQAKGEN